MPYESPMATESKPTDKLVIGSQYFLYFGVLGIHLPFFNLYCYHLGFSGLNIGVLSAVRSVAMVIFPLIWGALADRLGARRPIYILCSFCSALIWMQFLFTVNFVPMLIITTLYGMFYAPIISFLEAITMDILGEEKKSYGHIRVWGSISFIFVVLVLGKIIDVYSVEIIVVLILAGSLMFSLISTQIPTIRPLKKKAPDHRCQQPAGRPGVGIFVLRIFNACQPWGLLRFFFDPPGKFGAWQYLYRINLGPGVRCRDSGDGSIRSNFSPLFAGICPYFFFYDRCAAVVCSLLCSISSSNSTIPDFSRSHLWHFSHSQHFVY